MVQGGVHFKTPVLVNSQVKKLILELSDWAPLHNRENLEGIEWMESLFPSTKQAAVFDTTFHLTMPEESYTYAIPEAWRQKELRRYGFHGISHDYCSKRAAQILSKDIKSLKMIVCHLGNGSSLCAIESGRSVDTTMGLTPLELQTTRQYYLFILHFLTSNRLVVFYKSLFSTK